MHQLLDLARTSFDASDRGLRVLPTIVRGCAVAMTVCVLVWLLKPDLFGLVPNSLDPMFYTGYAINLDDALATAGNRHYFVTRWTSYMPMYLFSEIFGPYWGRLVLRLAMILVLSEMFWRFGSRLAFPTKSRLLGIFAVVTAPMFVRAFTTDYPEYFIIWGSMVLCLLVVSFADKPNIVKSVAVGVLAVSLLIANPFSAALVGFTLVTGLVLARACGVSWRWLVATPVVAGVAGVIVLVIGYIQFKSRYSIGNVYTPTIDFIQTYKRPTVDGWVTPTKEWLSFFPWIYLPPILIASAIFVFRRKSNFRRFVLSISAVSLLIFMFHVVLELRSGHALETSFYWSMCLGPLLILVFLLSAHFVAQSKTLWVSITAGTALCLMSWRIPQQLQIPSGIAMFIALLMIFALSAIVLTKMPQIGATVFVAVLLWTQMGAPTYTLRTNGGDLNSPRYDLVYKPPLGESHLILNETMWFLDQMDKIENDWKSTFLTAGGWSAAIVGTYIPHPFSRWVIPVSDKQALASNVRDELEFNYRELLVIYGDPQEVENLQMQLQVEIPRAKKLLDVTHMEGLNYRLVVMIGNSSVEGNSTISISRLDRSIGKANKDGSVYVSASEESGFVSFGPYFGLGTGEYSATLLFESYSAETLGYFEVFDDKTQKYVRNSLVSDGSGIQRSKVEFAVPPGSATWQLRTVDTGTSPVTYRAILLERVKK